MSKRKLPCLLIVIVLLLSSSFFCFISFNNVSAMTSTSSVVITNVTFDHSIVNSNSFLNVNVSLENTRNITASGQVQIIANSSSIFNGTFSMAASAITEVLNCQVNISTLPVGNYLFTVYAGSSIDSNASLSMMSAGPIRVTYVGDLNGDFKVDFDDLVIFVEAYIDYNNRGGNFTNVADFNHDGKIDNNDIIAFVDAYIAYQTKNLQQQDSGSAKVGYNPGSYINNRTIIQTAPQSSTPYSFPSGWYSDDPWGYTVNQLNFWQDPTVTHNGAYTIKISPVAGCPNSAFDFWRIPVHGGDRIVLSTWIKTSGVHSSDLCGARIGFDFYGADSSSQNWTDIGGYSGEEGLAKGMLTGASSDGFVHWGSDWTKVTWDFVVPSTFVAQAGYGYPAGSQVAVAYVCPWCQLWDCFHGLSTCYTAWFSDMQISVNPSGSVS